MHRDDQQATMRSSRRWVFPGYIVTLAIFAISTPQPAVGEETSAFTEARERFRRGMELYQGGQYEASLSEFQRAYELSPAYEVLFNIGQVHSQLAHFPEASNAFEQYLSEGGPNIPASNRAEAAQELARLRQLVGRIRVTVASPAGAMIYIDSTEFGRAPLATPIAVNSGSHVVEVHAVGHIQFRREVSVAGGEIIDVNVTLIETPEAPGTLVIDSNIIGATVTVDGQEVGNTPLPEGLDLGPGQHIVEVAREGYTPITAAVTVGAGEVETLEVELRVIDQLTSQLGGTIEVTASEDDVDIRLDGEPFRAGLVPAGPHLVEVSRPGFDPWTQEVSVATGDTVHVEAQLRPTEANRSSYEARARSFRVAAWVLMGVAIAAAAGGTGLFVWNYQERNDRVQEMNDIIDQINSGELSPGEDEYLQRRWSQLEQDSNSYTIFNGVSAGIWVFSGIAAIISSVLFGVGPNPNRYRSVSIVPSLGGLMLSASWGGPSAFSSEVSR